MAYRIFLYAGVSKYIETIQAEKDFMIVEINILPRLEDSQQSARTDYFEKATEATHALLKQVFQSKLGLLDSISLQYEPKSRKGFETIAVLTNNGESVEGIINIKLI